MYKVVISMFYIIVKHHVRFTTYRSM